MKTEKLFYQNQFQTTCNAIIIGKTENGLIFNKSIAYPEGGGQIGDKGVLIRLKNNEEFLFNDTTKINGRNIFLNDFPSIKVENSIVHHVDNNLIENIAIGEEFTIKIDSNKRSQITLHHSALHLALMVLEEIIPEIDKKIVGAKISEKYGRLDFSIDHKFSSEILSLVEEKYNNYVNNKIDIKILPHTEEPEALFWKCINYSIPCGGTHCENTKYLKNTKIKRKSIGKNSERLIVEIPFNEEFYNLYEK